MMTERYFSLVVMETVSAGSLRIHLGEKALR
jgi:hypothetical protein